MKIWLTAFAALAMLGCANEITAEGNPENLHQVQSVKPAWNYAHWDMSPKELLAASDGAARPIDYSFDNVLDGKPMLAASDSVHLGIPVQLAFYFNTSPTQLAAIDMLPADGDCEKMAAAVQAQMGEPDVTEEELSEERGVKILDRKRQWIDTESGDSVKFLEAGTAKGGIVMCKILLEPSEKTA